MNQKRAKMVVNFSVDGAESQAMPALMKKVVNNELWKVCKFIRNKKCQVGLKFHDVFFDSRFFGKSHIGWIGNNDIKFELRIRFRFKCKFKFRI